MFSSNCEITRKRQCILVEPGITGEVRFAAKLLGIPAR